MKAVAKSLVVSILGWQVRRLRKKNNFKIVAVAGSMGKTSTKLAVAHVLSQVYKVQYQDGNYNDLVSVPLVFFGQPIPSLLNPLAWLAVFWRNEQLLRRPYPYDFVVLELGTDGPGQVGKFKKYLNLELAILTSITPEHMEFFGSLDDVAKEELFVSNFSTLLLVNRDFCDDKYTAGLPNLLTYGMHGADDYLLKTDGSKALVTSGKETLVDVEVSGKSEAELYTILAAAAAGHKLGVEESQLKKALENIKPVPGRMQQLAGINNSTIIDDTYNASPEAVKLALSSLYKMDSPQKIAVLGNMNELGKYAEEEHRKIGEFCDPKQLSLVLTLGPDAAKYLAPAAESKGCKVVTFDSPYTVGDYLKPILKSGAVVLVKGSQNGVFAEEAVKLLLANPKDQSKLVRQSPSWLKIKEKAFK